MTATGGQTTRGATAGAGWGRLAVAAVLLLLPVALPAPAAASHDVAPARVGGATRIHTAAAVAELMFPQGTATALVARADDFPDALASAPLAGHLDAPVLLVHADEVPDATSERLEALGVQEVVILGGNAAVSADVERELAERYTTARIAGETRFATAAEIARELASRGARVGATPGGMRTAFLANGLTFADALAAGAAAASGPNPFPILLTRQDTLPQATTAAIEELGIEQILIVGGEAAVSSAVAEELEGRGLNVVRIAGPTRAATATNLADFATRHLDLSPSKVTIARSDAFADALAAAPLAGALDGPLLLTAPDVLSEATRAWLATTCPEVAVVRAAGGTAAVTRAALEAAERAAEDCHATAALLAYQERTPDGPVLVVSDVDGNAATVTGRLGPGSTYSWSPSADALVYGAVGEDLTENDLRIVERDGTDDRPLTSGPRDDGPVAWAPAEQIVFARGPARAPGGNLFTIAPDGTGLRQVTSDSDFQPFFPSWSPDGSQIAFQRFDRSTELAQRTSVWVVGADGTGLREISGDLAQAVRPAWSPGGEWIAFSGSQTDTGPARLYIVRPDGNERRRLTEIAPFLSQRPWSPDGSTIAFSGSREPSGPSDVYRVAVDGTAPELVADAREFDGAATWSPDGMTLAFTGATAHEGGDTDIFLVDADGTDLRRLTTTGTADSPLFAPQEPQRVQHR